jgi:hypothetical protein
MQFIKNWWKERERKRLEAIEGDPSIPIVENWDQSERMQVWRNQWVGQPDWRPLHRVLSNSKTWEDRQRAVNIYCHCEGRPDFLNEWVAAHPQSPLPYLVRGYQAVEWAWEARGSGWAQTVSEESWRQFFYRLEQAEADLFHAAELDPADPTPWSELIWIGAVRELDWEEVLARFEQAKRREPFHRHAYQQLAHALQPRWGGSVEEHLAFCNSSVQEAPDGNNLGALVPLAHLDVMDMLAMQGHHDGRVYFTDAENHKSLVQAYQRSLGSRRYRETVDTVYDSNVFAMTLMLADEPQLAWQEFERLQGRMMEDPWSLAGIHPKNHFRTFYQVARQAVHGQFQAS